MACPSSHNPRARPGPYSRRRCTSVLPLLTLFSNLCLVIRTSGKGSQLLGPLLSYPGRVPIRPGGTSSEPHPCLPALRKAVTASSTAVLRSKAPAWAPCHSMANSPDTWYTARGSSGCCGEWQTGSSDRPFPPCPAGMITAAAAESPARSPSVQPELSRGSREPRPMRQAVPRPGWEGAPLQGHTVSGSEAPSRAPPFRVGARWGDLSHPTFCAYLVLHLPHHIQVGHSRLHHEHVSSFPNVPGLGIRGKCGQSLRQGRGRAGQVGTGLKFWSLTTARRARPRAPGGSW